MAIVAQLVEQRTVTPSVAGSIPVDRPIWFSALLFIFDMFYVYILRGDCNHYIGYTSNIQLRYKQHLSGKTFTTRKMKNLRLLGYFEKQTKTEAMKLERIIKRDGHISHRINHPTFIQVLNYNNSSVGTP